MSDMKFCRPVVDNKITRFLDSSQVMIARIREESGYFSLSISGHIAPRVETIEKTNFESLKQATDRLDEWLRPKGYRLLHERQANLI